MMCILGIAVAESRRENFCHPLIAMELIRDLSEGQTGHLSRAVPQYNIASRGGPLQTSSPDRNAIVVLHDV